MRYNTLIESLQNLIDMKPTQKVLGEILGLGQTTISGRIQRNSDFNDEEIEKIEHHFGISIRGGVVTSDLIEVDYYPEVFGSCGSGVFVLSEQREKLQVPKKLFNEFSNVRQYSVINAIGDSMLPEIKNKDRLIVEHWEGEQILDNQVYVFTYNGEIFVKRLVKNIDEVIIKSDNPDPMYRPRFVEKEDMNNLYILGRIVGLMRDMGA